MYQGHKIAAGTRCVLPGPRTSIVRGNFVRETSVKRRNKIVQEITRNVANTFTFYAIIAIEHGFLCINIRQVPWEVLKTAAFGLGFQHLPRDLANVNAWKTMFDPYTRRKEGYLLLDSRNDFKKKPPVVFLLSVLKRLFCYISSLIVRLLFHMWLLCCPYLFLISSSIGASGNVLRDCLSSLIVLHVHSWVNFNAFTTDNRTK